MAGGAKHAYAIEYPEPLVHFALSLGASSDPAVMDDLLLLLLKNYEF